MSPCPHEAERKALLRKAFALEASPAEEARLQALTAECDVCRRAKERADALERLVDGGEGASERMLSHVLAGVPDVHEKPALWRRVAVVAGPILAAAAVLVFMVRTPSPSVAPGPSSGGTYTARGGPSAAPAFSVRLFCIPNDGEPRPLGAGGKCSRAAELALSVSSVKGGPVQIEAKDGAGKPLAVPPAGEVKKGAVDAVLPISIPLSGAEGPTIHLRVCQGPDTCREHEVGLE